MKSEHRKAEPILNNSQSQGVTRHLRRSRWVCGVRVGATLYDSTMRLPQPRLPVRCEGCFEVAGLHARYNFFLLLYLMA
ncbi:hypothetical protein EVAR_27370_1 [Eumeta japonica]|uniref:Uncharacterized protein n=1 Tax=Eumeta variegata TaxID=151549 RepID=A0A4C1X2Y4_EUMVA|nr:hypothetical protein EVAR_27370_1 [Eumeta japonica]